MVVDTFIYGRVYVREGWTNKDTGKKSDPRINYNSIQMLHDVMEKYSKKITLMMPLESISDAKIDALSQLVQANTGDKQIHVVIYESEEKINLDMVSRKYKIDITKKVLDALDYAKFAYKLN